MPRTLSFLLPLALTPVVATGQIYADFDTSAGPFTIDLDYVFSPQAAANFIRLAEGSVPWADSETGVVVENTPFFDGLTFHEAQSNILAGFGSRSGGRVDDPGWVFQDDNRSSGFFYYTAFMDNRDVDGRPIPNNNGSRIVITIPQVPTMIQADFTLLGSVRAATFPIGGDGYQTITDISKAPPGTVTINSVTIRRQGVGGGFQENAQGLPDLTHADLRFTEKANGVYLDWADRFGTVCRVWESTDLLSWPNRFEDYNYPGKVPLGYRLDDAFLSSTPRAFFRGAEVSYPRQPSTERALNLARIQCDFQDTSVGLNPPPTRLQFYFNVAGTGGNWSEPGGGGGVFTVDEFTPVSPFKSTLTIIGTGLPVYQFLLHYDRNGFTGQTEEISRLGGTNLGAPGANNELINGTWIYLPAP